jgi:hypothetical protein
MAKDAFQMNIDGVQNLISSKINKNISMSASSQAEGIIGEKIDSFSIEQSDEELILLAKKYESRYATYESKIRLKQQASMQYYLGRQKEGTATTSDSPVAGNFIFEAVETFLPAALSRNPEPVVWADNSPQGNAISDAVKTMLQYHADALVLRRKMELVTRNWTIDYLGVIKHGWNEKIEDIKCEVRDVKNFIFDPTGYVDMYGDFIGILGERITVTANRLVEMFPNHKGFITVMVDGKMGTDVTYTEWWDDNFCFYTYKNKILDKHKNPHFNYDRDEVGIGGETETVKGHNHFGVPKKPYTFLSVFSFGNQPHDVTSLIEQNIPNQRLISRRVEQIDYNISRANNSTILSSNNFNQETAKQFAVAKTKGHPALVPAGGPIREAVVDIPAPSLPSDFFRDLENNIENLRSIFGTEGITASGQDQNETARGMILKHQYDNSRIGGGIGDALEQFAKNVFNWWVQEYYVYYDVPHVASIMGQLQATQYIELSAQDLTGRLIVSVSPDSMKPHDEITDMNQALSLWEAGAIDPLTLLTRLHFPNAKETAGQFMVYKLAPQAYLSMNWPEIAQQLAGQQATGGAPQPGQGGTPLESQPPGSTGGVPASAALSNVPLPH